LETPADLDLHVDQFSGISLNQHVHDPHFIPFPQTAQEGIGEADTRKLVGVQVKHAAFGRERKENGYKRRQEAACA
jgi:hypothetical protein